ncbi:uncharacterized protein BKA55DRAFT_586136 [Fusarium redolens]|uniref:Uncharacterized protein n=1 Tax=Fusarium redolens TaxID=48865 RepID=A0A9P9JKF7_FUSRE|nr:uncharacterized protein BKA55DRAFT_586136 [Fusarium redolens]KAH7208449.1 hypothetical protein BKA55DRAFT_586136 [Fusarium redolens]
MSTKHGNQPTGTSIRFNRSPSRLSLPTFHSFTRASLPFGSNGKNGKHKVVRWEDQYENIPSLPFSQFKSEQEEERGRLEKLMNDHPVNRPQLDPASIDEEARKIVVARWKEEGIWDDAWEGDDGSTWRWRHERDDMERRSGVMLDLPSDSLKQPTRPISRFLHQLGKLVSKTLEENAQKVHWRQSGAGTGFDLSPLMKYSKKEESIQSIDRIGTAAFETVKHTWQQRGIWDESWGDLPGYAWKHERQKEDSSLDTCVHVPPPTTTEIRAPYADMGVPASTQQEKHIPMSAAPPPENAVLPSMSDPRVNHENEKTNRAVEIARQASNSLEPSQVTEPSIITSRAREQSPSPISPRPQRRSTRKSRPPRRLVEPRASEPRRSLRQRTASHKSGSRRASN